MPWPFAYSTDVRIHRDRCGSRHRRTAATSPCRERRSMPSEIRTFTEQDIDEAARLLAARHRRDRMRTPALSPRFDDAAAVRSGITAELAKPLTHGVVAVRDGDVEGFLIGTVSLPPAGAWY